MAVNCRVCRNELVPLLEYRNMPSVAQNLPGKDDHDKGVDLDIRQCRGCGLVQLTNDPVPYYKEVIRASAVSKEMEGFRTKQFNDFVRSYRLEGKKVLEVGCGRGEFLSIMKKTGVQTFGIEGSAESVKRCNENNLQAAEGFIDDPFYEISDGPFDAFFMLNYLEHLPDPNTMLQGIHNNLSGSAVGIVEVPNFDMILRKKLFSEFMKDHLFYFTAASLKTLLQLNGFDVIECKAIWHDYIISATVRKRDTLELKEFKAQEEKIREDIHNFVSENKNVAVWGAGHQAFAILALTGLGDKIKFIIDSAAFKQGRYTPVTHIPIVAPDRIDEADAIIVMAGSYSREVAGIIKENHPGKKIAILTDEGLK